MTTNPLLGIDLKSGKKKSPLADLTLDYSTITPKASIGDFGKQVGASAVEGVGYAAQGVEQLLASGINAVAGTSWTADNRLSKPTKAIRDTISAGGQAAMRDTFKGDWDKPEGWAFPETMSGGAMQLAQGLGSAGSTMLPVVGVAGKGARAITAVGAISGALQAGGAGGSEAKEDFDHTYGRMSDTDMQQSVPAYAELRGSGVSEQQARDQLRERMALSGTLGAGAGGAIGGAVPAFAASRIMSGRGIPGLNRIADSRLGQAGIAAPVGAAFEGVQETAENMGGRAAQNLGLGLPADNRIWEDSFANFAAGALTGGAVSGGMGALAGGRKVQPTPTEDNPAPLPVDMPDPSAGPLSRAANDLPTVAPILDTARLDAEVAQQEREAEQLLLTDQREQGMVVGAEGNAVPSTLTTQPQDYQPGGRGMDQSVPMGKETNTVPAEMVRRADREQVDRIEQERSDLRALEHVFRANRAAAEALSEARDENMAPPNYPMPKGLELADKKGAGRWLNDGYRHGVEGLVMQLTKGGDVAYVRDANDRITGRTASINPKWWQDMDASVKMGSIEQAKAVVEKALKGESLGPKQARFIAAMMDTVDDLSSDPARIEANRTLLADLEKIAELEAARNQQEYLAGSERGAAARNGRGLPLGRDEADILVSHTEADLADRARTQEQSRRAETEQEQRTQADAEVNDFNLSGSDRAADVTAAAGQADLLVAEPSAEVTDNVVTPERDTSQPVQAPSIESAENQAAGQAATQAAESKQAEEGAESFRMTDSKPKARITKAQADTVAKELSSKGIPVIALDNEVGLPADIHAAIKQRGWEGRVGGVYRNGRAYIIAANLGSVERAYAVALHEVVGHAGIKGVLGDRLNGVMRQVYRDMPQDQKDMLTERYGKQLDEMGQSLAEQTVGEEYVAILSETDPENPIVQRVIAAIRNFLRHRFGADLRWTKADLIRMLGDSKRYLGEMTASVDGALYSVEDGSPTKSKSAAGNRSSLDPGNADIRFSLADQAREAFGRLRGAESSGFIDGGPAMDARAKDFAKLRGFWDSASDTLRRTPALRPVAEAIDTFYDQTREYMGRVNREIDPVAKELRKMKRADRKQALEDFGRYIAAQENGRAAEAATIRKDSPAVVGNMIDSWAKVADISGKISQASGVQVYDAKIKSWRPIGKLKTFFPRTMKPEVQEALLNPRGNEDVWMDIARQLHADGRIEAVDYHMASEYLGKEMNRLPGETVNDYFAGIEQARGEALPEWFYDYSWDAAMSYKDQWAENVSRIEAFGQRAVTGKDLIDGIAEQITDRDTQNYLKAVQDRVYNVVPNDSYVRGATMLNTLATGLQLGNPATATLNLIGGTALNFQAYGVRRSLESMGETLRGLGSNIDEARSIGILVDDFLMLQQDAAQAGVGPRLQKFTSAMLRIGGYTPMETFIRTHAYVTAKTMLRQSLSQWNKQIDSRKSLKEMPWYQRNGFDVDKLIAENGTGPETNKFYRKVVNTTQGSYRIDQTPVFVDSPIGKFLFKYQKFGTQLSRMFWINHLNPFIKSIKDGGETVRYTKGGKEYSARVRNFMPMLTFFGVALLAGTGLAMLREKIFGYNDPGPGLDELEKALEDDDTAYAMALLAKRAWASLMAVGAFGFFGNYAQMIRDVADRQRVKSPIDPPALAPLKSMGELALIITEQSALTRRDLNDVLDRNLSLYRTGRRAGLVAAAQVVEFDAAALEVASRDRAYTRKIARRYADAMGIENRRRAPSRFGKTEMSPVNRSLIDAAMLGQPERMRAIARDHLRTLESPDEIQRAVTSMRSAVRSARPTRVTVSPSEREREDFMRWAKDRIGDDSYQRILDADMRYTRAAIRSGMMQPPNPTQTQRQRSRQATVSREFRSAQEREAYLKRAGL